MESELPHSAQGAVCLGSLLYCSAGAALLENRGLTSNLVALLALDMMLMSAEPVRVRSSFRAFGANATDVCWWQGSESSLYIHLSHSSN